jgi:RNA polymerase sigma-70 factor (ECF subfamily)
MSANEPASVPLNPHTLSVQQLFVQHERQLRAFVMSLTPDFSAAADVMQETFLEVSRQAAEFKLGSNFPAWTRSIAKFKVLALTRDRQRASLRLADDVVEALAAAAPLDEDEERHFAEVGLLRECVNKLAPAAREVVHLRYFGQHLPEGIAQLRSQSVNAINVTLARARAALRECMERGMKVRESRP